MRGLLLDAIREYQALSPAERAKALMEQYTEGGYLEVVRGWGKCDAALESLIEAARRAIEEESPVAMEMTDRAVSVLKSKGVP